MDTSDFKPRMKDYPQAKQILKKNLWKAAFMPIGFPSPETHLCCVNDNGQAFTLPIPEVSYGTHRLPASFFLDAFGKAGITVFEAFAPDVSMLIGWGFHLNKHGHLEKQLPPGNPWSKALIQLGAQDEFPYLLLQDEHSEYTLLYGQPKSLYHLLEAMESNGIFPVNERI